MSYGYPKVALTFGPFQQFSKLTTLQKLVTIGSIFQSNIAKTK